MSAASGRSLGSLFKRGWNEIPEVLGSTFMGLIGLTMGTAGLYIYKMKDGDNRRYKVEYTVIRDDDPRANYVRTFKPEEN